jgi:peptide/nickel transport system permease protein
MTPIAVTSSATTKTRSPWRAMIGHVVFPRQHLGIYIGATILIALVLAGYLAPLPHDPLFPYSDSTLVGPSRHFWFGTDNLGRDVFSRTIRGARLDVPISLTGTLLSAFIGVPIGLIVGGSRSRWANALMRGLDMFQAFPFLVLAIVIVALTGSSIRNVAIAIALIYIPVFIRLVRSKVLVLTESRFVEAATAIGASKRRILFRHILPNITGTILVQASVTAAQSLLVIAGMSYLGLGTPPPTPSWGTMIQNGKDAITTGQWWVVLFPGAAVFLCIVSFNLIADGLDAALGRGSHD